MALKASSRAPRSCQKDAGRSLHPSSREKRRVRADSAGDEQLQTLSSDHELPSLMSHKDLLQTVTPGLRRFPSDDLSFLLGILPVAEQECFPRSCGWLQGGWGQVRETCILSSHGHRKRTWFLPLRKTGK